MGHRNAADARGQERRRARRAADRPARTDKYADKPRGVESDLSEALAALLAKYGPEVPR